MGGLANDLDFIPALTGLSVPATVEHAIPYNLGYFRLYRRALESSAQAPMRDNPEQLAEYLTSRKLTAILMDHDMLRSGVLSRSYRRVLPKLALPSLAPLLRQVPASAVSMVAAPRICSMLAVSCDGSRIVPPSGTRLLFRQIMQYRPPETA